MGKIARRVVRIVADILTCGLAEIIWHVSANEVEENFYEAFVRDTQAEDLEFKDFKKSLKKKQKTEAKAKVKNDVKKLTSEVKRNVSESKKLKEQNKQADMSADEVKELLAKKAQQ